MKIAITGGSGFVGSVLAAQLEAAGHEVVVASRRTGLAIEAGPTHADRAAAVVRLADAFAGCKAVVHCAGINREVGSQTYAQVHVDGTRAVVLAARSASVPRIVMLSFLRARPDGPTSYHRSKWAAETIVRSSGIPFTILKAGVIHGRGDHLLDHLSRAFHTFPVFGLVGFTERSVRPVAVDDVARLLAAAALGDARFRGRTMAVMGPEEMTLETAVRRVAEAVDRRPIFVRLPIAAHLLIARVAEAVMHVPLVSLAQVHILAEGVVEPTPEAGVPPEDLAPSIPFDISNIRARLPEPGGFGRADLRWRRPWLAAGVTSVIDLTTEIEAPIDVVFDLARDLDLHARSMASSGERAIAGRTSGRIGQGESVTWRARHFGIWWTLTSRITVLDSPTRFVDEQHEGPFAWFRHEHRFEAMAGGRTRMVDRWQHRSPFGSVGRLVDRLVLDRHMRRLLEVRNRALKAAAEAAAASRT